MGDVVRLNRHRRRAQHVARKREDRTLERHHCKVQLDAAKHGKFAGPIRIAPDLYHEVHQALGEALCPLCLRCTALRRAQAIEPLRPERKGLALAAWAAILATATEGP